MFLAHTNDHTVKNSFHFPHEILSDDFAHSFDIASFDVKSLFNNIAMIKNISPYVEQCANDKFIPYNLNIVTSQFSVLVGMGDYSKRLILSGATHICG